MGKPVNLKSVDAASGTTTGKSTQVLGHYHYTLFAIARNLDSGNDTLTVAIEGSPDGVHWAAAGDAQSRKKLSESDFTQDPDSGVYTASVNIQGFLPYIRARVADYTDAANGDLEVDAYVTASGWPTAGQRAGRDNP